MGGGLHPLQLLWVLGWHPGWAAPHAVPIGLSRQMLYITFCSAGAQEGHSHTQKKKKKPGSKDQNEEESTTVGGKPLENWERSSSLVLTQRGCTLPRVLSMLLAGLLLLKRTFPETAVQE